MADVVKSDGNGGFIIPTWVMALAGVLLPMVGAASYKAVAWWGDTSTATAMMAAAIADQKQSNTELSARLTAREAAQNEIMGQLQIEREARTALQSKFEYFMASTTDRRADFAQWKSAIEQRVAADEHTSSEQRVGLVEIKGDIAQIKDALNRISPPVRPGS